MNRLIVVCLSIILSFSWVKAQPVLERVEPMFWWAGMKNPNLQLLIYGKDISKTEVGLNYPGVSLASVSRVENPNYLFINLLISDKAKPGNFEIRFNKGGETVQEYKYELKAREKGSSSRQGFNNSDVIYLITPDRFANGNPGNDSVEGMKEKHNRADPTGRHGGDIQGIIDHLDYIQNLGFTAVWLNPVLENNMTEVSYHGYSTTDFYKVDPRFGSNEKYRELSSRLKKRGMKLIMDMIFNHCGSEHWWMDDLPTPDWINNYPDYKISSHRRTVNQDPHASLSDIRAMSDGWFVPTMPDLNQRNPFLATYLIQNSIWWVEYAGLGGIRMDTYPYSDKYMMAQWVDRVLEEYPDFNIVGEEWSMNPAIISYWQRGKKNADGYVSNLPSLMDFPLQSAVSRGLKEKEEWGKGLIRIYEALANDFLYPDPDNLVVFPDNHDMSRFFTQEGEDVGLLKLGVAFFLTTRGIPQIYYGTEILMSNTGTEEHGVIRSDFPGGWEGDTINVFTGKGLHKQQKEMLSFFKTILNWRKGKKVVHSGKLIHFAPENGIYVYFRYNKEETVMVALNKNEKEAQLHTARFREVMDGYNSGYEVISSSEIQNISQITIPAKSAVIIELKK